MIAIKMAMLMYDCRYSGVNSRSIGRIHRRYIHVFIHVTNVAEAFHSSMKWVKSMLWQADLGHFRQTR
jgi:hypothetical protein